MKKILLIIVFLIPIFIKAETCNYQKQQENLLLSYNVDYEQKYHSSSKTFSIIFYNLYGGLYITYNNTIYNPDSQGQIEIENIKEGESINVSFNGYADGCNSFLRSININFGYYNEFYNNYKCDYYREKLSICNSEILSYKPSEELLDKSIENYNKAYKEEKEVEKEVEKEEEKSVIYEKIQGFVDEWGIIIIIAIISSLITAAIFRNVFRKIKHGI